MKLRLDGLQLTPVEYRRCCGLLGHTREQKACVSIRLLLGVVTGHGYPNVWVMIEKIYVEAVWMMLTHFVYFSRMLVFLSNYIIASVAF